MRAHRDLVATSAAAVLCAIVAAFAPLQAVRVVAAVPLTLALPGWALTQASFGRRPPDGAVLLMLTAGLSLAALAVGTVVLHLLPGRFGEASWIALVLVVTVGGCAIAARRRGTAATAAASPPRLPRPGLADAVMLGAAALAVAATAVVASTVLPAKEAVGYTRLWMLPSDPGAPVPHVRVGVVNQEQDPAVYRLALRVNGERTIRRMDLEPGEGRVWRVTAPDAPPGDAQPVTGRLFLASDPTTVYRRVNGWIPGA